MPQIKCIKCDKPAKYVSPEDFCQYHWVEWFAEGDEEYIQEILTDLGSDEKDYYHDYEVE